MKKIFEKIIVIVLTATLFLSVFSVDNPAYAADVFRDNGNATVTVTYKADDTNYLIVVENTSEDANSQRYWYSLDKGNNTITVPLSEGAGTYKIRICKKRSDGKATVISSTEATVSKKIADQVFEIAHRIVDYKISDAAIKKAKSLTKTCKNDTQKIQKIYNYVVKNYKYDYDMLTEKTANQYYVPDIIATYTRQLGICYDISCLVAGMLRAVGVESKVVTGYTVNVKVYHAWNRIYDSKKKEWNTIDATYDMCLYGTKKKFKMIKKDSEYSDIVYTY